MSHLPENIIRPLTCHAEYLQVLSPPIKQKTGVLACGSTTAKAVGICLMASARCCILSRYRIFDTRQDYPLEGSWPDGTGEQLAVGAVAGVTSGWSLLLRIAQSGSV